MAADLYKQAGVDIDAGNEAAKRYAKIGKMAGRPEVIGGIGGFSGGFRLDVTKYPEPLLVSGTDGVGTKIKVAFATNRHDTIGIDCVAMCVNDILTSGAEPLFFLDYLAVNTLDVDVAEAVVSGVAKGCQEAGCALIGGETAEMGDVYKRGDYDLAGTAVGVVNASAAINGSAMTKGDVIIGLASNGVHSNGYSLVRKLLLDAGVGYGDELPGFRGTVGDELLTPTAIYVKPVHQLLENGVNIRGMAHITGGGLVDNLPRTIPDGLSARLRVGSWHVRPVFEWLQKQAGMSFTEAARVWNMGVGYVVVVPREEADAALAILAKAGQTATVIGEIVPGDGTVLWEGAKD
ncbi:phosphoribosylformylglycinamidine cyclo-ligase [Alicyclobacillus mengziensis]|uniref:Phosphoribosylformylglycinamidine cyclo-ligase n=1 Tax=Alicyclobacillus mengziensis TaxID=2931921 RepID=A0A9X7VYA2_9BACL|nr:phosphoribosylformylglycinamidine cyclo-ligase [Alicyclobacillus mengziensis]QSO46960.1 phosphoribosylformylglycinamidine cyclo-ligase [Alicyclobacillus mengziensis]